jgi:NAD(P)-dependent dehydrogenase (short-subunit alcohol dehydrogenase family)
VSKSSELFDLYGKAALVTGGASGLGFGMARALGDAGAAIVLADVDGAAAESGAAALRDRGITAAAVAVDVASATAVEHMVAATLSAMGRIDVLVCSAGVALNTPPLETTESDFDRIVAVNFKGVFLCNTAVARVMIPQGGGRIVNISSLGAITPVPGRSVYCATKAAVSQLTKALAIEWVKSGVRVNAIAPGLMETPMTETLRRDQAIVGRFVARIPAGRLGLPGDLAGAVLFLASAASDYVIGQTIVVDGGWTLF